MYPRTLALAALLPALATALVAAPPSPSAAPNGKPAASATAPGQPKPFAEVVKEAKAEQGLFTLWRKDDKVWIEVRPEQLNKPFFFTTNLRTGIGERGLYAGMMGGSQVVVFRQVGQRLQLVALNTDHTAAPGTPIARAVADGFSESLLAAAPVASAAHPEHKGILVEAEALLLADLPGAATDLEAIFRQPYGFDKANSAFSEMRTEADQTTFVLKAHFALSRRILPPLLPPGSSRPPMAPLPSNLPDIRSLFLSYQLNFAPLPETPMVGRRMDDRVGYFATVRQTYGEDLKLATERPIIHRWRLEKADPTAALSKPKQPIVYWLDKNIPHAFRKVVAEGILEWNKAFEKIGFKDAVEVRQQPDDANWDTLDARHASIRWMVGSDLAFAIGPSVVDPRSGEILDADIGIGEFWSRMLRAQRREELPTSEAEGHLQSGRMGIVTSEQMADLGFGLDLMAARGELDPDGPEVEAYLMAFMKDLVTHEVGHTLGLRHNFKASAIYTDAQLSDPAFTKDHGIAGSVMEYNALNLAAKGQKQADYVMNGLGPYDFWAIEYGYKPIEPAQEAEELARIAAKGHGNPQLAYATDQDAGFGGPMEGMDPTVHRRDLGADPLAYAAKRVTLSQELWGRLQAQPLKQGQDFSRRRAIFQGSLGQVSNASILATKYIGGVHFAYDGPGSATAPLTPVSGARQREALRLLERALFNVDAFRFKPDFLATLVPNSLQRGMNPAPDYSLTNNVLALHRRTLAQLFQPAVMQRILDAPDKLANPKEAFRLSELYDGLQNAIWSELRTGKDIGVLRRNLQREHLAALVGQVLRGNGAPADARALARQSLRGLQAQLRAAQVKPGFSKEAKAHFADCLATLDEALKAGLQRTAI